jgi:hypothetical protein
MRCNSFPSTPVTAIVAKAEPVSLQQVEICTQHVATPQFEMSLAPFARSRSLAAHQLQSPTNHDSRDGGYETIRPSVPVMHILFFATALPLPLACSSTRHKPTEERGVISPCYHPRYSQKQEPHKNAHPRENRFTKAMSHPSLRFGFSGADLNSNMKN